MPASRTDPSSKASRARYNDGAVCDECGDVLSRKADLERHKQKHLDDGQKNYKYCPREGCDWRALQGLQHHLRTHDTPKPCVCPDCGKDYVDPSSLLRHRKKLHGYVPRKTTAAGRSDPTPKQKRRPRELPNRVARTIAEGSNPAEASTSFSTFRSASFPSVSSTPSNPASNASSPLSSGPSTPSSNSRPVTPISTTTSVFSMAAPVNPQVILPDDVRCLPSTLPWNWPWMKDALWLNNPFVVNQVPHQKEILEHLHSPMGPQFWMQPMDTTNDFQVDQVAAVKNYQCTSSAPSPNVFNATATFPGCGTTGTLDFNSPELIELSVVLQEFLAENPLAFQSDEPQPIFKTESFPEQATMVLGDDIDFSMFPTSFDLEPGFQPAESLSLSVTTADLTTIPQLFVDDSEVLDINNDTNFAPTLSSIPPSNLDGLEFNTDMPGIGADAWELGFNMNTFSTSFN